MTRLQPAIALDEFVTAGFGDRQSRHARREARRDRRDKRKEARHEKRQDRRDDRKGRHQEKKLTRVQRKKARVKSKLSSVPGGSTSSARRSTSEPTLQPAPMTYMPPSQAMPMYPQPQQPSPWADATWDTNEDVDDEEFDNDFEDDEFDATEGIGAFHPLKRVRAALAPRRHAPAAASAASGAWGPSVRMGKTLRIQAAAGHRAAVIDLKPGLFLVAELPDAVAKTEFGIVPLLAPLMINAAKRALNEPPREKKGPLSSLFRRRDEPVRYVQVQPIAPTTRALTGPTADDAAPMVVPAPNVGWADDATVAAVFGCECERTRR